MRKLLDPRPGARRGPGSAPDDASGLATMPTAELLDGLAAAPGATLALLVASSGRLRTRLRSTAPDRIAPWWRRLADAQRAALERDEPALVGGLGGIPYAVRSRANSRVLRAAMLITGRHPVGEAALRAAALTELRRAADEETLVSLDLEVPVRATVAVGDLDRATHVSYLVPGMDVGVAGSIGDYVGAAHRLRQAQAAVSDVPLADIAVVAWLGYRPPHNASVEGMVSVAFNERAAVGAVALASDLRALRASRCGPAPEITVVGHSYGTNVAALALTRTSAAHAVLLGSAGIAATVRRAADIDVPMGEVFATEAVADEWAMVGRALSLRPDPTTVRFGARVFSSEGGTVNGLDVEAVDMHGPFGDRPGRVSYLDAGSSALLSTALVAMGRGGELPSRGGPNDRMIQFSRRIARRFVLPADERPRPASPSVSSRDAERP
ncbi:alpha/beta hydrolase [Microbacterium sp. LMI1-1-1.1]|uniref:alpha/beta hydrolase n=1 Tax=Microbacterium sp. LMI1-1-1.1 TaxID=3135223 RepID=UPI003464F523